MSPLATWALLVLLLVVLPVAAFIDIWRSTSPTLQRRAVPPTGGRNKIGLASRTRVDRTTGPNGRVNRQPLCVPTSLVQCPGRECARLLAPGERCPEHDCHAPLRTGAVR